ncbi:MAG: serine/threonine-protein phosphatase, partial [Bacteroidetes bacterium]|nr:serine/threonine-protein phosphatase [Bacteroidota bacterium]
AGAHQQLYHIRVGELKEYKGNWRSIGEKTDRDFSYTNFEVNIEENDVIYLFTDGFPDQFGGDNRRKFKHKNFRELIFEIHRKPMIEQKNILAKRFNEWKGKNEQIDDVLVIGISFNT